MDVFFGFCTLPFCYQDLMILLAWMELLWLAMVRYGAAFARYDGWDGSDW